MTMHIAKAAFVAFLVLLTACTHRAELAAPDGASPFILALDEKQLAQREAMSRPNSWFEAHLTNPPVMLDGQTLHPKLQYEIEERERSRKERGITDYNGWLMGLWAKPDGRAWLRKAAAQNWVKMAYDAGVPARTQEFQIPSSGRDIRAKVYWPDMEEGETRPAILYFHGGAFLMANIEAVEPQMQIIVKEADMVVVSVDYSLAPEHVFPSAHLDALAAWDWLQVNAAKLMIDANSIGIGGDSAGANLAVVVANEQILANKPTPKAQLLYYPFTDSRSEKYSSFELFGNGFGLDKHFIRLATQAAVKDVSDLEHPWLRIIDNVNYGRLPPAVVATAGFDPIRDQGIVFAENLDAAGVHIVHQHYPSLNHGFLESSGVIDDAYTACVESVQAFMQLMQQ